MMSPRVKIIVIVGCLVVAAGSFAMQWRRAETSSSPGEVWYYDIAAQRLIPGPAGSLTGVRAFVFSCGDCDDSSKRFIGYLQKMSDQAVRELPRLREQIHAATDEAVINKLARRAGELEDSGTLVRLETDDQWISRTDDRAVDLMSQAIARCNQKNRTQECNP